MTYEDSDLDFELLQEMADSDEEFFITNPALNDRLHKMTDIMKERNDHLPFTFTIALYMLGQALDEIEDYKEQKKTINDMSLFIDSVFEVHERTLN